MRFASKSVTALALVFSLAACGGGAEQAEEPAATATEAMEAATPVAVETAAVEATPTESPSPTPTETAAPAATPTAAAAPAAAAAVTEPAAFAVCKACHSVEPGKNGIGPSLAGIWGEKAGAVPGFEFSDAMKNSGLTWNQASLDKYLTDPKGVVPGTKMMFGGVKDAAKRQQIIDYIKAQ